MVAVCLIECRDVDGIILCMTERAKVDGRHIPEDLIRQFNRDRAKLWFTALLALEQLRSQPFRAFVDTRLKASDVSSGLVELHTPVAAFVKRHGGFDDEEAAQRGIDKLRESAKDDEAKLMEVKEHKEVLWSIAGC